MEEVLVMEEVFVDSDIILDLLGKRKPFDKPAEELFTMADKGEVKCYI
jgi:predicted nucleic acid-binding protein